MTLIKVCKGKKL